MQMRCYRCGFSFGVSRENLSAALAEMTVTGNTYHMVYCPRCRTANKLDRRTVTRFAPPVSEEAVAAARAALQEEVPQAEVPPAPAPVTASTAQEPEKKRKSHHHRRAAPMPAPETPSAMISETPAPKPAVPAPAPAAMAQPVEKPAKKKTVRPKAATKTTPSQTGDDKPAPRKKPAARRTKAE